jgi:hypothetical protein
MNTQKLFTVDLQSVEFKQRSSEYGINEDVEATALTVPSPLE